MIAHLDLGRGLVADWSRVLVMGVVNVTPDSFSDGGRYLATDAAIAHGLALRAAGADILDVGGEATNPRAAAVAAGDELARILPVIEGLAAAGAVVSVDTTKAAVARAACAAGATIVNDVAGGAFDPDIAAATADAGAVYVCGHLRGASLAEVFAAEALPEPRRRAPASWREVADELAARLDALPRGLRERTIVDPGLGFGKGADGRTNAALIAHAGDLARALGRPVLVGPSRKRFIGRLAGDTSPAALDAGTVGACLAAVAAGAHLVRTHDVSLLRPALAVYEEIARSR